MIHFSHCFFLFSSVSQTLPVRERSAEPEQPPIHRRRLRERSPSPVFSEAPLSDFELPEVWCLQKKGGMGRGVIGHMDMEVQKFESDLLVVRLTMGGGWIMNRA